MSDLTQSRALCAVDDIDDPGTRGFEIALEGQQVLRLFVVRKSGTLAAYRNNCPHTGAPLEWLPHQFFDLEQSFIQCAIHGALFRPEDGYCVRGPCVGRSLEPLELEVRDGRLYLAAATGGPQRSPV